MDRLVESARESAKYDYVILCLRENLVRSFSVEIDNIYPVHLRLQAEEAGCALHEVGGVLVLVVNHGNALHACHSMLRAPGTPQSHLG